MTGRPDSTRWILVNPAQHGAMPAAAGVYVIYLNGEPVIVGQSQNMRQRFGTASNGHNIRYGYAHNIHTPWGTFDDFEHGLDSVTCKYRLSRRWGDILMWEARLILKLQPRFNQRGKARWAA